MEWWCGQPRDRAHGAIFIHDGGWYRVWQDMNKEQRQAEEHLSPRPSGSRGPSLVISCPEGLLEAEAWVQ